MITILLVSVSDLLDGGPTTVQSLIRKADQSGNLGDLLKEASLLTNSTLYLCGSL